MTVTILLYYNNWDIMSNIIPLATIATYIYYRLMYNIKLRRTCSADHTCTVITVNTLLHNNST